MPFSCAAPRTSHEDWVDTGSFVPVDDWFVGGSGITLSSQPALATCTGQAALFSPEESKVSVCVLVSHVLCLWIPGLRPAQLGSIFCIRMSWAHINVGCDIHLATRWFLLCYLPLFVVMFYKHCMTARVHKNKSMQHHTLGFCTAEFQVTWLPQAHIR